MLLEAKDPAIKLFGMKIPLPAGADDEDLRFTSLAREEKRSRVDNQEEDVEDKVTYMHTSFYTLVCVNLREREEVCFGKSKRDPFVEMPRAFMG